MEELAEEQEYLNNVEAISHKDDDLSNGTPKNVRSGFLNLFGTSSS